MKCSHCGGKVEDNSEFCPHCGEPFHEHEEPDPVPRKKARKRQPEDPHGNTLKILIGVAVVLAVILVAAIFLVPRLLRHNSPVTVTTPSPGEATTTTTAAREETTTAAAASQDASALNGDWQAYFSFDTADGSNPELEATLTLTATGGNQLTVQITPVAAYKGGKDAELSLFLAGQAQATYQDGTLTFAYAPFADVQEVTFCLPVQTRSYGFLAEADGDPSEFQATRLSMTYRK